MLKRTVLDEFGVESAVGTIIDVFKKSANQVLAHRDAGLVHINTQVDLSLRKRVKKNGCKNRYHS